MLSITKQKNRIADALADLHFELPLADRNSVSETVAAFGDWAGDTTSAFYNDSTMYISTDNGRRLNAILTEIMENVGGNEKIKNWSRAYFLRVAELLVERVTFVKIK